MPLKTHFQLRMNMNTYITTLLLGNLVTANIMISSEEANEVIQIRQKRGFWEKVRLKVQVSNLERECFEDDFCREWEDFQEAAENVYSGFKHVKREDPEVKHTWKLYRSCHYERLSPGKNGNKCSGNSCECNVPFKEWLKSHYPQLIRSS